MIVTFVESPIGYDDENDIIRKENQILLLLREHCIYLRFVIECADPRARAVCPVYRMPTINGAAPSARARVFHRRCHLSSSPVCLQFLGRF